MVYRFFEMFIFMYKYERFHVKDTNRSFVPEFIPRLEITTMDGNVLGEGVSGRVLPAVLDDGAEVAVKLIAEDGSLGISKYQQQNILIYELLN